MGERDSFHELWILKKYPPPGGIVSTSSKWFNKSCLFINRDIWALQGKISFISLIADLSSSFKYNKYLKEKLLFEVFW